MSLDLEAIKGRLAKIKAGPWRATEWGIESAECADEYCPDIVVTDAGCYPPDESEESFIVHAPEDIAALVAEVERLREEIEDAGERAREQGEHFL